MTALNRREFCAIAAAAASSVQTAGAASKLPNIVFILADDLGWGDLRCYNSESRIPTPHADRLARSGMRLTDMHSPSAVCTPTRYGIMTGRYCWRSRLKNGVLWGYSPNLIELGRTTVASLLKTRGYYTGGIGKWHLGLGDRDPVDYKRRLSPGPREHGFDYYFGIPASLDMEPYLYFENDRVVEQPTAETAGSDTPRGVFWRKGPIAPSLKIEEVLPTLTAKAVNFVRQRAKTPEQPFFLYLPLTAPHTPWLPGPKFRGRSKAGDYGDFVVQTDDSLGQVMRALDETGLAGNTLLIFTSDNGAHWTPSDKAGSPHRANARWRGMKADIHEAGHRVPFIARWPGNVRPGSVSNQLGCLTDLLATAGEITGAVVPKNAGEDSYSLVPTLTARNSASVREAVVHHSSLGMFAIRHQSWKLVLGRGSGGFSDPKQIEVNAGEPAGQLYNLSEDPSESNDVYSRNPEIVKRLSGLLEQYRQQGFSRT